MTQGCEFDLPKFRSAQVQKGRTELAEDADLDRAHADACLTWSAWRLARYDLGILWQTIGTLRRGEGLRY